MEKKEKLLMERREKMLKMLRNTPPFTAEEAKKIRMDGYRSLGLGLFSRRKRRKIRQLPEEEQRKIIEKRVEEIERLLEEAIKASIKEWKDRLSKLYAKEWSRESWVFQDDENLDIQQISGLWDSLKHLTITMFIASSKLRSLISRIHDREKDIEKDILAMRFFVIPSCIYRMSVNKMNHAVCYIGHYGVELKLNFEEDKGEVKRYFNERTVTEGNIVDLNKDKPISVSYKGKEINLKQGGNNII